MCRGTMCIIGDREHVHAPEGRHNEGLVWEKQRTNLWCQFVAVAAFTDWILLLTAFFKWVTLSWWGYSFLGQLLKHLLKGSSGFGSWNRWGCLRETLNDGKVAGAERSQQGIRSKRVGQLWLCVGEKGWLGKYAPTVCWDSGGSKSAQSRLADLLLHLQSIILSSYICHIMPLHGKRKC